jgi:molybdate transport system substrate-binding protein
MKRCLCFVVIFSFVLARCGAPGPSSERRTLTIYAAASLTDAFAEIGEAFETGHPGVSVMFNFGGSQNLRTQIEQGAPADVFASAHTREMDALVMGHLILADTSKIFLTNRLVVILPKANPAGIESLQDLAVPGLKLVLAAEEVPAGRYARQMLGNLNARFGEDYSEQVLANVVSNEDNIRQAVTKVQLGEADVSIVYVSDAIAVPGLQQIEISSDMNVIAEYPIAALAASPNMELANEFIEYVLSPEAQAKLAKWGFTPVIP